MKIFYTCLRTVLSLLVVGVFAYSAHAQELAVTKDGREIYLKSELNKMSEKKKDFIENNSDKFIIIESKDQLNDYSKILKYKMDSNNKLVKVDNKNMEKASAEKTSGENLDEGESVEFQVTPNDVAQYKKVVEKRNNGEKLNALDKQVLQEMDVKLKHAQNREAIMKQITPSKPLSADEKADLQQRKNDGK